MSCGNSANPPHSGALGPAEPMAGQESEHISLFRATLPNRPGTRSTNDDQGRTRFHFHKSYRMENRLLTWLIEKPVHRFISRDDDKNVLGLIRQGLAARRACAGEGPVLLHQDAPSSRR